MKTIHGIRFAYIPAGTFWMGSPEDEPGRNEDESLHKVRLTKGFYMQITPVTQGQWEAVMGNNPSHFKEAGPDAPVEQVSWEEAQKFIEALNFRADSYHLRLPTEAEWEYACRAGTQTEYHFGNYPADLDWNDWHDENSGGKTHPVCQLKPNAWGLYDIHGNVAEWCQDWYGDYPNRPMTDPTGPEFGARRVIRGGSWDYNAGGCRSAVRYWSSPSSRGSLLGFRVLAEPSEDASEPPLEYRCPDCAAITYYRPENPPDECDNCGSWTEIRSSYDPKSHYYDAGGIETLDIIRAKLTNEQFRGFLLGNALKYLSRLNHKDNALRDAEKASQYIQWLKEEMEE